MVHTSFNNANHHIKFDIEHPNNDGSLSLLDFTVNVSGENPVFHPYTKSIKSTIFTSGESAMPTRWKRNIISNEWKRLRSRCTSMEEKKRCRSAFIEKLKENNHQQIPFLELNENSHSLSHTNNIPIFYLSIPFIDDQTNTMVRKSIRGLGYQIRLSHRSTRLCDVVNNHVPRPPLEIVDVIWLGVKLTITTVLNP